ncbi:MAG: GNAT family N-acetyltransferase [Kineosporiaceae bacterium]
MSGLAGDGWQVVRDPYGVPTVRAGSTMDLVRGQGHVTAVDRAWQLQVERWCSEGRLAEHIGPAGLAWDTFARRARLDDTARRCFEALDATTRGWLEAYVQGVVAGLADGAPRSPELRTLGRTAEAAGTWRPWHPLGVFLVRHVLFGSVGTKLWRAHVRRTLGATPGAEQLAAVFGAGPPDGSNAVAVHGARTVSGRPLIAGDPHRILERPGVYQQVHLVTDEVDVLGLAFPGVPGVAHFGHTGTVAWAITNAMADYQDLYRERLRRDGGEVRALGPQGWEPVARAVEVVAVRGAPAVEVEVLETTRGPVVVPSWDPAPAGLRARSRTGSGTGSRAAPRGAGPEALSLRTPSRAGAGLGFETLPRLLRARTVDDVEAAWQSWVEPVNSVLVADVSGEVRRLVAGWVPERDAVNNRGPVPAWEAGCAWRGRRPLDPAVRVDADDPGQGIAVTANDRRPDVARLGVDFALPHRAERLRERLTGRPGLTVDDLADVLLDTVSLPALDLLRRLATATAGAERPAPGTPEALVLATLAAWDGRMAADDAGAGAFAAWRAALVRLVVDLPVLAPLSDAPGLPEVFLPWLSPSQRVAAALAALLDILPGHGVDVDALARRALTTAAGEPPGAWGERHRSRHVHALDGTGWDRHVPRAGDGLTLAGDADCVLATAALPAPAGQILRGPTARYVWDLADRDASRWVVPLGADGAPGPHHADQAPLWATGRVVPVPAGLDARLREGDYPFDPTRTLEVRRLDPAGDAALVHRWVSTERARHWGMAGHTAEQVRQIYAEVESLDTHHAYLVAVGGMPVALLQTYDPGADAVGETYPVTHGDLGIHLLLAPAATPEPGFTATLAAALARVVLADDRVRRIVVEPDAANTAALARLRRTGFELGPEVDLPGKRARLAFIRREDVARMLERR